MTPIEQRILASLEELGLRFTSLELRVEHMEKHLQAFGGGLDLLAQSSATLEEIRQDVETVGMLLGGHVPGREGDAGAGEASAAHDAPANGADDEDGGVFDTVLDREA